MAEDGSELPEIGPFYKVEEVAAKLGVSPRWLADQCRGGRVEHVHMARQRLFTPKQVEALIAKFTERPEADVKLDLVRERAMRSFRRPEIIAKKTRRSGV